MLTISLRLQTTERVLFTPFEAPFKGGVLHGFFENALHRFHPRLWQALRGPEQSSALYALGIPQDSDVSWPADHVFALNITLYSAVQALWPDVLAALTPDKPLLLGNQRVPCLAQDVHLHRPGAPSLTLLQAMGQAGKGLSDWQVTRPNTNPCTSLTIALQAPCLINSHMRRQQLEVNASPLPFTLSTVVASVQRRVQYLEPTLAEQYGFGTPEWHDEIKQIWPHQIADPMGTAVWLRPWPYVSRNTPGVRPVNVVGMQGQLTFSGPTPDALTSLLSIGQWVGLGQKASLGMGWYSVDFE